LTSCTCRAASRTRLRPGLTRPRTTFTLTYDDFFFTRWCVEKVLLVERYLEFAYSPVSLVRLMT
jgi:hypothetical protein